MTKVHARRYIMLAAVLAAFALIFWVGCSKDLMSPDKNPPEDSSITNPVNMSSLNQETINVRGRAEVGATIDVFVKDVTSDTELLGGTALSSPAVPDDGLGGRYTVEEVALGNEGMKILRAKITDLYGNVASTDETPTIAIILDQTPPSISFDSIEGADWIDTLGIWKTSLPSVIVSGSTDTSAAGARLRSGADEYAATMVETLQSGVLNFTVDLRSPPVSGGHVDTVVSYYLESFDDAGNVAPEPVFLHWEIEGREEELFHDDGSFDSHDHTVQLRFGDMLAVGYQAPTWAHYVTKMIIYNANDQETHPTNPTAPTSKPFTAWVWHTGTDDKPGDAGNDGYAPFSEPGQYPEDEWVTITFPNAIDIRNNANYPDKRFFVGLEWEARENPRIYEDHTPPITYTIFVYDPGLESWDLHDPVNTMIHAVVSDVPALEGKGREAVLAPTYVKP